MNIHRIAGVWFRGRQVVIANGIVSTGLALGFMIGAGISDTIMSPLLGGWENVLLLYGGISIAMGVVWLTTNRGKAPVNQDKPSAPSGFRRMLSHVFQVRNVWFLAFGNLFYCGCLMGFTGYLSLYLRGIGWSPSSADGALAVFNGAGMLAAIPLSLLASRLGSKKVVLIPSMIIGFICVVLLGLIDNSVIWILVILFGVIRDGYFAVLTTVVIETEDIGVTYAGTAIGIVWTFGNMGSFISPPISNILAGIDPRASFAFWAVLMAGSVYLFSKVREAGKKSIA
jgi:cyanate permease